MFREIGIRTKPREYLYRYWLTKQIEWGNSGFLTDPLFCRGPLLWLSLCANSSGTKIFITVSEESILRFAGNFLHLAHSLGDISFVCPSLAQKKRDLCLKVFIKYEFNSQVRKDSLRQVSSFGCLSVPCATAEQWVCLFLFLFFLVYRPMPLCFSSSTVSDSISSRIFVWKARPGNSMKFFDIFAWGLPCSRRL